MNADGFGYAQAYSQFGEQGEKREQQDQQQQSRNYPRRLEATSGNRDIPMTQVTGARLTVPGGSSSSRRTSFQATHSLEKGGGSLLMPSLLPRRFGGFNNFPAGASAGPNGGQQQSSSYTRSSSFSSLSSGSGADGSAAFGSADFAAQTSWSGPIPSDASVTQETGSSYKTYTWKVTDASGYTTTHWYTGPLGADRIPPSAECHSSADIAAIPDLMGPSGRRQVPSWTAAIPSDATITQTLGSPYKTYTWKVTDASGYTTTHWYSGPLGPDGAPAQIGLIPSLTDSLDQSQSQSQSQIQSQTQSHGRRTFSESSGRQRPQQPTPVPAVIRVTQPQLSTVQKHSSVQEEYQRQQVIFPSFFVCFELEIKCLIISN